MAELMLKELGWVVTEAFDKLLDIERLNEQLNSIDVISELERFQLWAQNLGLFQDGHASLDYRVRDAAFVKDRLAELLRELMEHVRELSLILSGERQPAEKIDMPVDDSSSSSGSSSQMSTHSELSSSASSFHEVEFRFNSLTERLDALYSLATKIRNPKNRPSLSTNHLYKHVPEQDRVSYICDREEIEANVVSYILRQHIIESPGYKNIRDSHGEAIESFLSKHTSHDSWIIRRTGKANARRKQQLLYWKDHALRLGQAKMNTSQIARPTIVDREAAPNQHNLTHFLDGAQRIVPSLTTSATKLPTQKLDDLKSTISHQSRQSTVISVHNDVINWPPPPTKRGKGRYFECPYCRTFCPIRYLEKRAWETHIIHDLQAYHCTYERCQDPNRLYGSRQEWIDHESQHTRVWICQEHDEEFETQPDYTDHLKAKHPELQSDRISEVLIAIAVGSSTQVYRDCPFCPSGFNDNLEMQQHIELHLWRLALLALPPIANDSNDNDESVQSFDSHQAQQLGRTGSIIGDFGFKHGLQKLPCSHLEIGNLVLASTSDTLLAFYDVERSRFCFCFEFRNSNSKLRHLSNDLLWNSECILQYNMSQVSDIKLSPEEDRLIIVLKHPPTLYIYRVRGRNKQLISTNPFENDQAIYNSLVHSLQRPLEVRPEEFNLVKDWLHDILVSLTQDIGLPKQNSTKWNAAIQDLSTTQSNDGLYEWALDVTSNFDNLEDIDQVYPPDKADNMITETEGLSWRSESEYHSANERANATLPAARIDNADQEAHSHLFNFSSAPSFTAASFTAPSLTALSSTAPSLTAPSLTITDIQSLNDDLFRSFFRGAASNDKPLASTIASFGDGDSERIGGRSGSLSGGSNQSADDLKIDDIITGRANVQRRLDELTNIYTDRLVLDDQ